MAVIPQILGSGNDSELPTLSFIYSNILKINLNLHMKIWSINGINRGIKIPIKTGFSVTAYLEILLENEVKMECENE